MKYPANVSLYYPGEELNQALNDHHVFEHAALYGDPLLAELAKLQAAYARGEEVVAESDRELYAYDLYFANYEEAKKHKLHDYDELILFYDSWGDLDYAVAWTAPNGCPFVLGRFREQTCLAVYRAQLKDAFPLGGRKFHLFRKEN